MKNTKINPPMNLPAIFEKFKIRRHFDEKSQRWFFSIVDVVAALIEQEEFQKARKYWNKLKERLALEGSEVVTNCHQLKMIAEDGKMRETDTGDLEAIFRLIQSIPSPRAEPFKMWLAKVGSERIVEISDPEISLNRARQNWRDHMSEAELIFTALAELSTRQIAETLSTKGLEENKIPAKKGGKIVRDARIALEKKTGQKVVSENNFLKNGKKIK